MRMSMRKAAFPKNHKPKPQATNPPVLTPGQEGIARRQEESETLAQRRDANVVPESLIERLGNALGGASVLWSVRRECVSIKVALTATFAVLESNLPIFEIKLTRGEASYLLPIQCWRLESTQVFLTTDFPSESEELLTENGTLVFTAALRGAAKNRWSVRITSAMAARF